MAQAARNVTGGLAPARHATGGLTTARHHTYATPACAPTHHASGADGSYAPIRAASPSPLYRLATAYEQPQFNVGPPRAKRV